MLQPLPFDQPVTVVSLQRNVVPGNFSVKSAPNVTEIRHRMANLPLQEVWPVSGPSGVLNAKPTLEEKTTVDVDQLSRLKIAALVAIISQKVFCFVCNESGICAQQLMNQTEFDFQSALIKRAVYERELANYRKISHQNLVQSFKAILSKLLERFYGANESRFDQTVLNFVVNIDTKKIETQFSYTEHQLMLAKQYVYSALYDGQLLQFDSAALEIYCAKMQTNQDQVAEHSEKPTVAEQKTLLEKIIAQIQKRTAQIFQRNKLFNQLIGQCIGKTCHEQLKPTFAQLSTLTDKENVWELLRTSPIEYNSSKNSAKAAELCTLAFASRSEKSCKQLEEYGFFDDSNLLTCLIDNGSFEKVQSNTTRRMLLKKVVASNDIAIVLGKEKKTAFKRALWLLSLTVYKNSKREDYNIGVQEIKNDDTDAKELLKKIYEYFKKTDNEQQYASHRKKIESFLLKLGQYNLLLLA